MRLLRTQEAAERLGLHPASVRRMAAQGVIPHFKVGGWRLFEARAVEALRRKRGAPCRNPHRRAAHAAVAEGEGHMANTPVEVLL